MGAGLLVCALLGCDQPPPGAACGATWSAACLPTGVTAIDGIGDEGSAQAFAPLAGIIGDARFVGLGESVHTVGTFYEAKRRMIRHLIEEEGFRAVAFETNWDESRGLRRFLAEGCQGDVGRVLTQNLFGVWVSTETVALFEDLCAWNAAHPDDPVQYFGFDVQQPYFDFPAARTILEAVDGVGTQDLRAKLARCVGVENPNQLEVNAEDHAACLAGVDELAAWASANAAAVTEAFDAETATLLPLRAVGLRAYELEIYHLESDVIGGEPDVIRSFEGRDQGMAIALQALADLWAQDQRVIVWAANTHLAHRNHETHGGAYSGARSMGTYLREDAGDAYVAVALTSAAVEINWPGFGRQRLPAPVDGSFEAKLHAFATPYLLVDTARATQGEAPLLPAGEEMAFMFNDERMVIADQFAGVFFADDTTGMVWLP